MPKIVSEIQKKEIIDLFLEGETVDQLSKKYNCTKNTINRYLKQSIDEKVYKSLCLKNKNKNDVLSNNPKKDSKPYIQNQEKQHYNSDSEAPLFVELTPIDYEIENEPQKELSSVPISEVDLPKVVYMIVDKKVELETKYLKEYPAWQFLSNEDLNRKTIEIHIDLKIAKRFCNKDQKVIKVTNTQVFKIAAPILLNNGITRIVSEDKLIAL